MEPLFETETLYTFEEHKKLNKVFFKKVTRYNLLMYILYLILGVFAALYFFLKRYDFTIVMLATILICIIISKLKVKIATRRAWTSNRLAHGMKNRFLFYDDHFEVINSQGNFRIFYNQLYKILETETNIYLLPNNTQGYIIKKTDCSAEFSEFIKKIKSEYKK